MDFYFVALSYQTLVGLSSHPISFNCQLVYFLRIQTMFETFNFSDSYSAHMLLITFFVLCDIGPVLGDNDLHWK